MGSEVQYTMQAPFAIYHTPAVPWYVGNPFIEALPPPLERNAAKNLMRVELPYDDAMRRESSAIREHLASGIDVVREPTWLHADLYARISRLICKGYERRNPTDPAFQRHIAERQADLDLSAMAGDDARDRRSNGGYDLGSGTVPASHGLMFLGTSGIGKSTAIEMVLGLWPRLIVHREHGGRTFSRVQVVHVKVDVPQDGSILALALKIFNRLDEVHMLSGLKSNFTQTYYKSRSTEATIAYDVALAIQQIGLGILVIDELQDLSPAKSRKFLSFMVQLVNLIGIPVVLVGGMDAFAVATEQFRQVRRGSGEGDLVVTPSEPGARWTKFCEVLWKYQFTSERAEMTPEIVEALYEQSQGITDLLVIAYKQAQIRAISAGAKQVTPGIIRSIRDTLNLAQPALAAMRRKSSFVIDRMSDLKVPAGVVPQPFLRADDTMRETPRPPASSSRSPKPEAGGKTEAMVHGVPGADAGTPAAIPAPPKNAPPRRSAPAPTMSSSGVDDAATMAQIVADGAKEGKKPSESLREAGLADGDLWRRVAALRT